jgi:addiction module HigA family antidote
MARKHQEPISPGEILFEEFMQPLGISINALARDLSVPPNRISEIVNGKRAITADTALRLARRFGTSAELWLNLQTDYALRTARRISGAEIEAQVRTHAV